MRSFPTLPPAPACLHLPAPAWPWPAMRHQLALSRRRCCIASARGGHVRTRPRSDLPALLACLPACLRAAGCGLRGAAWSLLATHPSPLALTCPRRRPDVWRPRRRLRSNGSRWPARSLHPACSTIRRRYVALSAFGPSQTAGSRRAGRSPASGASLCALDQLGQPPAVHPAALPFTRRLAACRARVASLLPMDASKRNPAQGVALQRRLSRTSPGPRLHCQALLNRGTTCRLLVHPMVAGRPPWAAAQSGASRGK